MKYSKMVMKHFKNPKNMGEMKNPDAVGKAGNPICGDTMKIYLKIKNDKITDIKFQTLGCAVAIAMTSILTEMAKKKTLEEALKIKGKDLLKNVEEVPKSKMHCSVLAQDALKDAIKSYNKKHKTKK